MSSFGGIDFSTQAVDLVLVDENTGAATRHHWPLIGQDAFERTRNVADAMPARNATFWDQVIAVAIEEPQGAQKATVAKLKAIQGAILGRLPSRLLVTPMAPNTWRKLAGLGGHAPKSDVAVFAGRALGHYAGDARQTMWSQDAYDAWCLAVAMQAITQREAA